MPHAYAAQFRAMVVEQVRSGRRVAEVAAAVEVPEATVFRWVRQDRIDRGELSGTTTAESAELRAANRRITGSGGRASHGEAGFRGDTVVAAAILDRAARQGQVINIKGPSWRPKEHGALTKPLADLTDPPERLPVHLDPVSLRLPTDVSGTNRYGLFARGPSYGT